MTRRGPGFSYWLLDKDGLELGCRLRMDTELAKALVIGYGTGHRLEAVKNDILWQYGFGLRILDSELFKTRLVITRHVLGGRLLPHFMVKTGITTNWQGIMDSRTGNKGYDGYRQNSVELRSRRN